MPRPCRSDFAGCIYHALNRGNERSNIFFKAEDYESFEHVIKEGLKKYPVDLICYQWMKNHWHKVLSPQPVFIKYYRAGIWLHLGMLVRSLRPEPRIG